MEAKQGKFNITETIRRIRSAREDLQRASKVEHEVTRPILTDYSHISIVYGLFCQIAGIDGQMTVIERKMFVFIIQYLYEPRNLFGRVMPSGLRREMARVLGLKGVSVISRCASCTLSEYRIYTQFRNDVNRVFGEIIERLAQQGIIDMEGL